MKIEFEDPTASRFQGPLLSPMPVKVVAFDCDGVMFDTREANTAYYNRVLEHFGRPAMSPAQIEYTHMHTVGASLSHLFGEDTATLAEAEDFRRQMTYEPFISRMIIEPGLRDLLERLRGRFRTAVATNRTDTMRRVLDHWGLQDAFDLVVSAGDVPRPKPHPDMLLHIASHFEVEPSEMVYIGDSKLDERAARSAGVRFFAFRNDHLDAEEHLTSLCGVAALVGDGKDARS